MTKRKTAPIDHARIATLLKPEDPTVNTIPKVKSKMFEHFLAIKKFCELYKSCTECPLLITVMGHLHCTLNQSPCFWFMDKLARAFKADYVEKDPEEILFSKEQKKKELKNDSSKSQYKIGTS